MHRFFVSPADISGDAVVFPRDLSRQISRVLRMSSGDEVTVLDDSGWEYTVVLSVVGATHTEGRITGGREGRGEPAVCLTLWLAMIRPERFEWALQKCVELGVSHFVPVITSRTTRRYTDISPNRRERWRRIIREAAEQSGRSRLPVLGDPQMLEKALYSAPRPAMMAWERETRRSPKSNFEAWGSLVTGIGRRILRSETAAVVLVTAIMHELGELAP